MMTLPESIDRYRAYAEAILAGAHNNDISVVQHASRMALAAVRVEAKVIRELTEEWIKENGK